LKEYEQQFTGCNNFQLVNYTIKRGGRIRRLVEYSDDEEVEEKLCNTSSEGDTSGSSSSGSDDNTQQTIDISMDTDENERSADDHEGLRVDNTLQEMNNNFEAVVGRNNDEEVFEALTFFQAIDVHEFELEDVESSENKENVCVVNNF
jgi:hypothetical protein